MILKFKVKITKTKIEVLKRRFSVIIDYKLNEVNKRYVYQAPNDILDDIGAKELASRIYSVFKQHISRPASE